VRAYSRKYGGRPQAPARYATCMADIFELLAERWNPANDYTTRPVEWIAERTGEFAWSQQRKICESVVNNRYTAVHSAHDLGKSFIASRIGTWWMDVHPTGEAFLVSTAPTAAQVSAILWREISKAHTKAQLQGRINRAGYPQWYVGSELIGYGRKPADYEESAFQGIHARYPLIIIDEACGVAKHLFNAVDALATNENARVLAIGNPDDPGSHFASICKPDSDWNVIHLDGLRSPNLTKERIIGHRSDGFGYANPRYPLLWALMRAEQIPFSTEEVPWEIRDLLVSELWIEERIRRWAGLSKTAHIDYAPDELEEIVRRRCAASPLFASKVRGIFPSAGTTGVIPLGWVQQAINRWHDVFDRDDGSVAVSLLARTPGRKILGVDVARGGEDETAVSTRYGNIVERIDRMRLADTMETVDFVAPLLNEPHSIAVVDVIGIGAGVYDRLRQMHAQGLIRGSAIPFNAGASSSRSDAIGQMRFRNDRAAAWWRFRELLDPSRGSNICLPDDERLIEELVAVKYEHHVGGIIKIESKDEIKKRLGRSTDTADSVIQSFWIEGQHANIEGVEWGASGQSGGVVRYAGYDAFTDKDLAVTPGFGGSGSNFTVRDFSGNSNPDNGWDL
jgi:hypothetical protein